MTLKNNSIRTLTVICMVAGLISCTSTETDSPPDAALSQSTPVTADGLLARAQSSSGAAAVDLRFEAIELLIDNGEIERASNEIAPIRTIDLFNATQQLRFGLLRTTLALEKSEIDAAMLAMEGISLASTTDANLRNRYYYLLGTTYKLNRQLTEAIDTFALISSSQRGETSSANAIWLLLSGLDQDQLSELATEADNYELRGWIELTRVVLFDQFSIKGQLQAIEQWRRVWPQHSAFTRLPDPLMDLQQVWDTRPKHIALILPVQQAAGIAIQEGFFSAYYQALEVSREVPKLSIYDSSGVTSIYPLYEEAVASGADLIIGPLNKDLVNQLQELPSLPVPTLALNYADIPETALADLYQFGLAPEDEIAQAIELAWQAGYRNAAVITPESDDYLRLQNSFNEQWLNRGGQIVSHATFSSETDYAEVVKRLMAVDSSETRKDKLLDLLPRQSMEFIPRRREDMDFIFLIANPRQGRQIKPTLAFYFAEDVPVYAMPSIYDGQLDESVNRDLDGIIFTDAPWMLGTDNPLKNEISSSLRQAQGSLERLRAMGIDCFRLYPRLNQLNDHQVSSLLGATGLLTLNANRQFHRTLSPAQFINGTVRELTQPSRSL